MGKIEKFQLVTNRCRYFDKQNDLSSITTEGIHTKFCIKTEETVIIILGVTNVPTAGYGWAKMQVVRNDQIYKFL